MDNAGNAFLTEHLQYPPIALIDDIINSVNEILYRCTSAIEAFLQDRVQAIIEEEVSRKLVKEENIINREEILISEIEKGTAHLELMLEASVDKNFDRFELYVLRNILTIPSNVIEKGAFRLEHQENIVAESISKDHMFNKGLLKDLIDLQNRYKEALIKRKKFRYQIHQTENILIQLNKYLISLNNTISEPLSSSGLSSLPETISFLILKTKEILAKINQQLEINSQIDNFKQNYSESEKVKVFSERNKYINELSKRTINNVGLVSEDDREISNSIIEHDAFELAQKLGKGD